MAASSKSACRNICIAAALLMLPLTASAETLTGTTALGQLSGKNFRFKCSDNLHGYGRFERQGTAWANYRYSSATSNELERRATATLRAQGKEVCLVIRGFEIAGEICAPVRAKSAGNYRFGSNEEWCDVQVIPRLPGYIQSVESQ